ncbi:hypothetical protein [Sphingomonas sp. CFBP 8760]|uniref:hypothetical protein n=1 Tax=Sphingomonas sp. CFBP 8760 TaxID=2775282 RepID=UPI00177D1A53|nr:hypothetical protein [Sphingomonas sp. CFBP 8760]MBD8546063.1 hypothetical protein [Sphingomonas sp. CFBP 8760]
MLLLAPLSAGCSADMSELTCADIAREAISLSNGEIISINNRKETSRTDDRAVCHGTALTKGGGETPVRFLAFRDDDGEVLIKYDDDEHQRLVDLESEKLEAREAEKATAEMQKAVDDAMDDARHEAYAAAR